MTTAIIFYEIAFVYQVTLELSQAGIPPHGTTLFRGNAWSSFIPFNFPVASFVEMWGQLQTPTMMVLLFLLSR